MLVVSARTAETRGAFTSAKEAAAYEELLLFTQRARFALVNDEEKGGRGKADTDGARLGKLAASNERDQRAIMERVDALLAEPDYVDSSKVDSDLWRFLSFKKVMTFSKCAALSPLLARIRAEAPIARAYLPITGNWITMSE